MLSVICGALFFALYSLQFNRPAVTYDEVNYLAQAAFFFGYPPALFGPQHFGYSLLLSPLFVFESPSHIYLAVRALNGGMLGAAAYTMFTISRELFPEHGWRKVAIAVLVASLYPTWLAIGSYAFPTVAQTLVFVLAVRALQKSEAGPVYLYVHSILAGFCYWLHPVGAGVAVASFLVLTVSARGSWILRCFPAALLLATVVAYRFLSSFVKGEVSYSEENEVLSMLLSRFFWTNAPMVAATQLAALFVSTIGSAALGALFLVGRLLPSPPGGVDAATLAPRFMLFSMLMAVGISVIANVGYLNGYPTKGDVWTYGRYTEPVIFPLIVLGLLKVSARRELLFVSVLVATVALFPPLKAAHWQFNHLNMAAFWPAMVIPSGALWTWYLLGALAIALRSTIPPKLSGAFCVFLFTVAVKGQTSYHKDMLNHPAVTNRPTSIIDFVNENLGQGDCLFWEYDGEEGRRRHRLYVFFFNKFGFQQGSVSEWQRECDGPLISSMDYIEHPDSHARIVARSQRERLQLIVRTDTANAYDFSGLSEKEFFVDPSGNDLCLFANCWRYDAADLSDFAQVGVLKDGSLQSTGERGYLYFGPYASLLPGRYTLVVNANGDVCTDCSLTITSSSRVVRHTAFMTGEDPSVGMRISFEIPERLDQVQFKIAVGADTEISLFGIEVSSD